jgi:hypothetical protein
LSRGWWRERERRQRRARVRGVAFLTRAALRQKEEGGGEKKPIPNFLLLAPHDRSTVTAKSQKLNLFFLPKHSGFFLTAARCSERSQAGRDSNGCGCRRVPTADEWSESAESGGWPRTSAPTRSLRGGYTALQRIRGFLRDVVRSHVTD